MRKRVSVRWALYLVLLLGMTVGLSFAQGNDHDNHGGRHHGEDWPEGLEVIEVNGTAILDSLFWSHQYFLDTTLDGEADYQLGFGPWWYNPDNGAERPNNGDNVSILGGIIENDDMPFLVVYRINDLFWRDSTGQPPWSGDWIHHGANDSLHVFCPTDSMSHLGFPPQSMMGMGFPDSLYCQFEEIDPDSMPGMHDSTHFAGFLCDFINPEGNHMGGGMGHSGMMNFNQEIQLQFHYDEVALEQAGLSEESITLWYMNADDQWVVASTSQIDQELNTVAISTDDIAPYYYLSAPSLLNVDSNKESEFPDVFNVVSAFPNPFNPSINIDFVLEQTSNINFNIYDLKGRRIHQERFNSMANGSHTITWTPGLHNADYLKSGVYIVELVAGETSKIQKVTYLK
ncbi:MAG: T9SS type A sorting domain-containing protein [Candidatus Marinimicrobia bacterium]|nr:T9SS type A sorting domain-containing protein [Candidatus Neomarinimicrobiota bacterium]